MQKIRDGESLTTDEKSQVHLYSYNAVRALEAELKQHALGMLDDDELDARIDAMRINEAFKPEWLGSSMVGFTPGTRTVVDELIKKRST